MTVFKHLAQNVSYLIRLLVHTPNWGWILLLQLVSGFASFLGLPLLIPVLDMMQQGHAVSPNHYSTFAQDFLKSIGIFPTFNAMLWLAAALILIGQLLVNASSLVAGYVREDLLRDYRKRIFNAYAGADWQWVVEHHSARMYHAVIRESEQACEAHINAQRVFINLSQVIIFLLIAIRLSWRVTLLAAAIYGVLALLNAFNLNIIKNISVKLNNKFKQFTNDIVSFQHNKKFIKIALLSGHFIKAFDMILSTIWQLRRRQMVHVEIQRAWTMMSTSILLVLLIYFKDILNLSSASLLLSLFVFMRLAPQILALVDIYAALDMNIPMHQSLQEHLQVLEKNQEQNGGAIYQSGMPIVLKNIVFAYQGQPTLLKQLNMTISANKFTAIVGKSGCGKSTIIDLILGLFKPVEGDVLLGNVPIAMIDKSSFRKHVALVGQRPTLIDGTLYDNLAIAMPNVTEAQLMQVCQQVHLDSFINELPQGFQTQVGENGLKLSGGQRQKIALARCLLLDPEILILDEATSELDSESESVVQLTLKESRKGKTTIVIAHRLSTVKPADIIYVLDNGVVLESGSYDQLIQAKGKFFDLVSRQQ